MRIRPFLPLPSLPPPFPPHTAFLTCHKVTITLPADLLPLLFPPGEGSMDPNDPNRESTLSQLSKTEISLSLTSKYDVGNGEAVDSRSLLIR